MAHTPQTIPKPTNSVPKAEDDQRGKVLHDDLGGGRHHTSAPHAPPAPGAPRASQTKNHFPGTPALGLKRNELRLECNETDFSTKEDVL